MEQPNPLHYLVVRKDLVSSDFTLGKNCRVVLNLATPPLLTFLRAVYEKDKFALQMSPASQDFLMTYSGNRRHGALLPTVALPTPIDFKPRIISYTDGQK